MNRTGQRRNVCRYFAASGSCFYGEQCQFLHVSPTGPLKPRMTGPVRKSHSEPKKLSGYPAHIPSSYFSRSSAHRGAPVHPAAFSRPPSSSSSSSHHTPLHYQVKTSPPLLPPPPSSKQLQLAKSKAPPPTKNISSSASARTQVEAGGTTYFYSSQQAAFPSLYTAHTSSSSSPLGSFFVPEELRAELLERQAASLSIPAEESSSLAELESYHSLCPLEPVDCSSPTAQPTFGYPSTCYRAVNMKDSLYYCLRRLHGLRLTSGKAVSELEKWRKLQHAGLVTLREMFTTKAFGDNSVVFVYDYHAAAESLKSKHLTKGKRASPLPEPVVWEYTVQLLCGINHVHRAGLALRCVDASKVLMSSKSALRLKINCAGIVDVLTFDNTSTQPTVEMQQQEDLVALGQVLLCVTLQSSEASQPEHFHHSMETLSSSYSPDLHSIVSYLLQSGGGGEDGRLHSAAEALPLLGSRLYSSLERSLSQRDALEAELGKEVQNGRLFRLLAKLGTITERPEYAGDDQWAETGDRYLLKLFRDFLFHQVLPSGQPWVDLAHIVQTLNKLDAGCPDLLALHARDESSALVVSYSDLKSCLDTTFSDVLGSSSSSSS